MRPQENEYAAYYASYIALAHESEPIIALEKATEEIQHFLPLLPEAKADFEYAAGKWTVKELLQHMIDTERIMAYRALTIARGDKVALPGFDENAYVRMADTTFRTISDLRVELLHVRKSSLCLFQNFGEASFRRQGIANNQPVTVLALAYIIAGHQRHHFNILRERYFPELQLARV